MGLRENRKEPYHEQDQTHRAASCDLASQGSSLRSSGNPTPSARVHFICGCRNRWGCYGIPAERSEGRATHRERGDSRAERVPSARRTHERRNHRPSSSRPSSRVAFRTAASAATSTPAAATTSAPASAASSRASLVVGLQSP